MDPRFSAATPPWCEDQVFDGPASGGKGSKGRNELDCIRGKRHKGLCLPAGVGGGVASENSGPIPRKALRGGIRK